MTSKQILDAFSETLMQDERILSSRERELLMSLLQNARTVSNGNAETHSAVNAAIARSVGETVAQRAFSLLGSSIVKRIVARGTASASSKGGIVATEYEPPGREDRDKAPPGGQQPPTIRAREKEKDPPSDAPAGGPEPPGAPQAPSVHFRRSTAPVHQDVEQESSGSVAVLDDAAIVPAQCVVLDEFLAPQEVDELIRYTLQHDADFRKSEVISPTGEPGATDYTHRRSRVLMDTGVHKEVILDRIRCVLPRVLEQLRIEEFSVSRTEVQITASNDGDFFRAHCDDAQARVASRRITFVYFFHNEPRQFEGGELRLYDARRKGERPLSAGRYQTIVPEQNQVVFFPCSLPHEITPVECPSRAFADSRFTLNGWLHK
jgi:SM-20-related protein